MKKLELNKIYKTRNGMFVKVAYRHLDSEGYILNYHVKSVEDSSISYCVSHKGTYYFRRDTPHELDILMEEGCELPKKKKDISLKKNFSLEEVMDFE